MGNTPQQDCIADLWQLSACLHTHIQRCFSGRSSEVQCNVPPGLSKVNWEFIWLEGVLQRFRTRFQMPTCEIFRQIWWVQCSRDWWLWLFHCSCGHCLFCSWLSFRTATVRLGAIAITAASGTSCEDHRRSRTWRYNLSSQLLWQPAQKMAWGLSHNIGDSQLRLCTS